MSDLNSFYRLDWKKMGDLIPAIVQNAETGQVLMLAYMNQEALTISLETKQLTLYSRSKERLWTKGETSLNTMQVINISQDCDGDSLLVQVKPKGVACHLGFKTCFQPEHALGYGFLGTLVQIISDRATENKEDSYTAGLIKEGLARCAQKVGEEAVETVIAAMSKNRESVIEEGADLLFHWLVLLQVTGVSFGEVLDCLEQRHARLSTSGH